MTANEPCHRAPLPKGKNYQPPINWLEADDERMRRERIAVEQHLADLEAYASPPRNVKIKPRFVTCRYREITMP
jgi:hypothetical protein